MDWSDLFIFVLGVFLLVAYTEIVKSIDNEIGFDSSAARSIQGIYTIGIIFVMNSIYSLSGYETSIKNVGLAMEIFMILLGIVLIVLSSIILNKTKNMKDKKAKNWSISLITAGSLMVVLSFIRIGYGYYKNHHTVGPVKYGQNQVQLPDTRAAAPANAAAPAHTAAPAHNTAAAPEHHFPTRHTFAFF